MAFLQTEKIITINGFEMHYKIYGEGKALLLLHGFTGSGAALVPLFNDFASTYQLIIPDLRGHGKSTNPSKKFTHRQAALDVFTLLDHLNIKKCFAIGFSCGGNILLHMGIQQTDRIEAMSIVSATPYYPREARELMKKFIIAERSEEEWQAMRKIHLHGDEQIKMIWQQANSFSESYDDMNLTPPELAKIKAKTLIIQGDSDPFYPMEISVEMYRNISNASLWVVPNGGHGPLSEELIPIFKSYLLQFMQ